MILLNVYKNFGQTSQLMVVNGICDESNESGLRAKELQREPGVKRYIVTFPLSFLEIEGAKDYSFEIVVAEDGSEIIPEGAETLVLVKYVR